MDLHNLIKPKFQDPQSTDDALPSFKQLYNCCCGYVLVFVAGVVVVPSTSGAQRASSSAWLLGGTVPAQDTMAPPSRDAG